MSRHIHTNSHLPNAGNETNEATIVYSSDALVQTHLHEQPKLILDWDLKHLHIAYSVQLTSREKKNQAKVRVQSQGNNLLNYCSKVSSARMKFLSLRITFTR